MINKIIQFSIKNKLIIGLMMIAWIAGGIYSMQKVPIDATPDITNNQIQVITTSPNLGTEDIEQFITYPVELAMSNLPGVTEIRSISRFGLSVVTIVFKDSEGTFIPRQLVAEKLIEVKNEIPNGFGEPFMGPISTGLGEIYQYTLEVDEKFKDEYTSMNLRTYQDWIVKRQMAMLPGVVEVNSFGGRVKQYEVAVSPDKLKSMGVTIIDVFTALQENNQNTGGAYIVKDHKANFIKGEGLLTSLEDMEKVVVKNVNGIPILVRDVATVQYGEAIRYGSVTKNGQGDAVGGVIMMLKGANSNAVIEDVKTRMTEIEKSLPEGISIVPFLERSALIERTTSTVTNNLLEGGLIVILVLVLFLGNFRGGLIVASTIPLSLLFAYVMMNIFGVWSNLMSLGAIDFGIIVDGAVIIVESVVFYTVQRVRKISSGKLDQKDLDEISEHSSKKMMNAAFFGQLIILITFIPILTLQGIEGKMFTPMALTFSFAVIGAMILCLTYVPMISALFMSKKPNQKKYFGDKFIDWLKRIYEPVLEKALKRKVIILTVAFSLLVLSIFTFTKMGGEFVPELDEGDIAMHAILKPGSSLDETEKVCTMIETAILAKFPEVKDVVSKIGVAEIPTDPMPLDIADMFLIMKPRSEWTSASTKDELVEKIKEELAFIPAVNYEFSQPVEMRFNELMTGVRQDVAVKLFGDDLKLLQKYAQKMEKIIKKVDGVADTKVEAIDGLPQMTVRFDRGKLAQYGLSVNYLNTIISTSFGGKTAGVIFDGEKKFDMVVRLRKDAKKSIEDLKSVFIALPSGQQIPLKEVADIDYIPGPMQISREGTNRRTYVGVNVRGRDVESVVLEIQEKLEAQIKLPPGYYVKYGGSFENLQKAKERLMVVVPIALILIFVLLYFALKSFSQTIMIYLTIPLSIIGGIFSLWLRDMPFSISAGVGFIVLFGVAVLNGLVLITSMNDLKSEGLSLKERIKRGTKERIRPIFLTASTDILGFLPMAISSSAGAEVQRPLATVVIGGLLTASVLTLIIIPIVYDIIETRAEKRSLQKGASKGINLSLASFTSPIILIPLLGVLIAAGSSSFAQQNFNTVDEAIAYGLEHNKSISSAQLEVERLEIQKRTSFNINKTQFGVQYGQYNTLENDFGFSVNQGFQFPTVYTKQGAMGKELIKNGEIRKIIAENELIKDIKLTWYNLLYLKDVRNSLTYQDSVYSQFVRAAELRFEAGAGTLLEKMTAESKVSLVKTKMVQNYTDILIGLAKLKTLVGSEEDVSVSFSDARKKEMKASMSNELVDGNPKLALLNNEINLQGKKVDVNKAKLLPSFSIGYVNTSIVGNYNINGVNEYFDGSRRFSSVQASIAIPIFARSEVARIKASKLNQQIASTNADYYETVLKSEYERVYNDYIKYKTTVEYYENTALEQANLILANSKKSFENGAINYVEYIQGLTTGIEIRNQYIDVLSQYNQSIIAIEYLGGVK
ncbi:MAG: CusA/CzcA family heavy metal efflux RND transporter [Fluviicola sp.]|nr:CusA/CzcA family heavy metal efflux RND transporter [Fluviicola sp.]